jgi:hypothetical protein
MKDDRIQKKLEACHLLNFYQHFVRSVELLTLGSNCAKRTDGN